MILIVEREDLAVFSFFLGTIFGSFLNLLIFRLPQNISIIRPRSYCPTCKCTIAWYNNIPLVSFCLLKARCANCNEKISMQYLIVEVLTAFITLFLFIKLGFSLDFLFALILFYTFIVLVFIDLKYKAVPDYLLLIIFIVSFFVTPYTLRDTFINACLISGFFVLLNFLISFYIQNIKARVLKDESLKKQEAIGEGDIPILALLAIVLGLKGAFAAIFLAVIFAIIPSIYFNIIKKDIQIPFIPYLFLGFSIEYFFYISKVF